MAHSVAVGEFEGPLGLLLELVERNKIEVTAISVADITAQYLGRIGQLGETSPEALGEFLNLGARLLYIKSLALLPQAPTAEAEEELRQLNLDLAEYRRFQAAARLLSQRVRHGTWERQAVERLAPGDIPVPDVTLDQLAAAVTAALKRTRPAPVRLLARQHLSLDAAMKRLRPRLAAGFTLDEVLAACQDRLEIIVLFLALLELVRDGSAHLAQTGQFTPITVGSAHV